MVVVCTNESLNDNYIVLLPYAMAMKCLSMSKDSGSRRISIKRIGQNRNYLCYGIGGSEQDAESVSYDWQKYIE